MVRYQQTPSIIKHARKRTALSMLRFLARRLAALLVTLFTVTVLLYGVAMTFPPEARADLYFPKNLGKTPNPEKYREITLAKIIKDYGLNDPFPVQYARWLSQLVQGNWGWSPTANEDVLPALVRLTPATAELSLYSLLLFIPLGLASGVIAGSRHRRLGDLGFRLAAFLGTSMPPFVLSILLLAVFYVAVHWFPPERLGDSLRLFVSSDRFHTVTGLLTVDGLLNGRPDISLEALRHLVLPVVTLSLYHWATLGRVTRAVMIEELGKDYIIAARARGISDRATVWRHALRNALVPALNSTALSAAALITGVFVVESIYNFGGISKFIRNSLTQLTPDVPAMLGFTIYSVILVLVFIAVLDLVQAAVDPRIRERMASR